MSVNEILWWVQTVAEVTSGVVQIYDSIANKNDISGAIQCGADTLHKLSNQVQSYGEPYSQQRTSIVDNSQVIPVIQPDVMPPTPFNPPVTVQQPQSQIMPYCCQPYSQQRTSIVDNSHVVPVIKPNVMPPTSFNPPVMVQQPQPQIMPYCCQPYHPVFHQTQVYGYQSCQPYYHG